MKIAALFTLCLLAGCTSNYRANQFETGYDAGWNKEKAPASWSSQDQKDGYRQGLEDSWSYDEGYYDGESGKKPQYIDDPIYMEGFIDGKNHR